MSNGNENELAFPFQFGDSFGGNAHEGLTKREYFAGLAMQGILSKAGFSAAHNDLHQYLAQEAVKFADALLTELANE